MVSTGSMGPISADVVDRKIGDQQGYWIRQLGNRKSVFVSDRHFNIKELRNLKELTGT
jgi:hypothetical protein